MEERILSVEHLEKKFGNHTVLKDIDFSVSKGEVVSIIGAPDRERVRFCGV